MIMGRVSNTKKQSSKLGQKNLPIYIICMALYIWINDLSELCLVDKEIDYLACENHNNIIDSS